MQSFTRCAPLLALAACISLPQRSASANELVMVQVRDGRVLIGEVDSRTDERFLWMRVTSPSLALSTAVRWDQVAWAQLGNRTYRAREFREVSARLATKLPKEFFKRPQHYTHPKPDANDRHRNGRLYITTAIPPQARAMSLAVEARVVNWDGDANTDGIEITIAPLSSSGKVIPVDGTLLVELIGQRYRATRRQRAIAELEKWSQRVRPVDFGTWGATYRIPFRSFFPDNDRTIAVDGQLEVRLSGGRTGPLNVHVPIRLRP